MNQTTSPFTNSRVRRSPTGTPEGPPPRSEKQERFLAALLRGAFLKDADPGDVENRILLRLALHPDKASCRTAIDQCLTRGVRPVWDPVDPDAPAKPKPIDEDGIYFLSSGEGVPPVIYKVQVAVHGSGNLYAKELIPPDIPECDWCETRAAVEGTWTQNQEHSHSCLKHRKELIDGGKELKLKGTWEYRGRAPLHLPLEKLTLKKAKEFGQLYGMCYKCGAVLTNEKSIALGIGPVCRGRF